MTSNDTVAAVATGSVDAGLAIVRVSGSDAAAIAARVFRPVSGDDPAWLPGYSVRYGSIIDPITGSVTDDGLLTTFRAPHSYTGEDTVEISCHGGRISVGRVLAHVLAAGARPAQPGEFTLRAFLNGRIDLAQAEAVAALIRSRSEAARRAARRQLEGALSRSVAEIKDRLVGVLAAIEVTIDFSDEVDALDYRATFDRLESAEQILAGLLATADRGRVLREGFRVAIVGRPNVGKSSLLNALLRSDRAIVTPVAGTTRDLIEEFATLHGLPFVLVDTAGVQDTEDPVESIGVSRAEEAAGGCDVVLFVVDASAGIADADRIAWRRLTAKAGERIVIALNKSDVADESMLSQAASGAVRLAGDRAEAIVSVSAMTGDGLDRLEFALAGAQNSGDNGTDVVLITERHRNALDRAAADVRHAMQTIREGLPADFIAIDLNGALEWLAELTGERVSDEVIHRIFQDFCVGK